jgi:hypothetical protein
MRRKNSGSVKEWAKTEKTEESERGFDLSDVLSYRHSFNGFIKKMSDFQKNLEARSTEDSVPRLNDIESSIFHNLKNYDTVNAGSFLMRRRGSDASFRGRHGF